MCTGMDVEALAAVRFHVFAMPELLPDEPSALRIHMCPVLPDQISEMEIVEKATYMRMHTYAHAHAHMHTRGA